MMKNSTIISAAARVDFHGGLFLQYLPVVVFFAIAALIGIVGNIIVVKFYRLKCQPKTSFTFLVRCLAYADITVCVLLLVGAVEIGFNVSFKFKYLCKVSYFMDQWSIYVSTWLLVEISVDRYRKICQPFKKQMSVRLARRSVPVIVVVSLILASRNLVVYDIVKPTVTVATSNGTFSITAYHCALTTDPDLQTFVCVLHWTDIVSASALCIINVFAYGSIIHKLVRHRKSVKVWRESTLCSNSLNKKSIYTSSFESNWMAQPKRTDKRPIHTIKPDDNTQTLKSPGRINIVHEDEQNSSDNTDFTIASDNSDNPKDETEFKDEVKNSMKEASIITQHDIVNTIETTEMTVSSDYTDKGLHKDTAYSNESRVTIRSKKDAPSLRRSEYQTTVMMVWVIVVFLLSLTSFFIGTLVFRRQPLSEVATRPLTHFLIKCVFLNSVSNPIIYYICNTKFRVFVNQSLTCKYSEQP